MEAILEIREPGRPARRVTLQSGQLTVGREGTDVVVDDAGVSRRHLALTAGQGGLTVADLGSRNGTTVNGVIIEKDRAVTLQSGDIVRLAATDITVMDTGAARSIIAVPLQPVEPAGAPDSPAAAVTSEVSPALGTAVPSSPPPAPTVRPALDELTARESEAAVIRFRRGSAGEAAASGFASAVRRARRRLAGFGSESWGARPQICLVDPFPDPDRPGELMTSGTVVDANRGEIWMVVTAESPPEPPERPLALLFGSVLPDAADLSWLVEGYGLHLAGTPDPNPELRELDLPAFSTVEDEELAGRMALSFVRFLLERGGDEGFRRFLSSAQPGRAEAAAAEVYGVGLAALEQTWQRKVSSRKANVQTGQFIRVAARYLRPHVRRELEMFVYMLAGLSFTMVFPFAVRRLFDSAIPSGQMSNIIRVLAFLGGMFAISLLANLRRSYLAAYVSSSVTRQVRTAIFGRLQSLSTGWYGRQQQGDVLSRLLSDVTSLESGLSETLREGLFQTLSLLVSSIILLTLNVPLGLVVLAGAPIVAVVYKSMSGGARRRSRSVQEQTGGLVAVANENFMAQPVVKAFGLERREQGRFRRACDRLFSAQVSLQLFGGLFGLSVNTVVTALRLIVLGFGSWLILQGNLTIGGLVAFLSLMGEVISPVTVLTGIGQRVQAASGALERINEVLDEQPEVDDAADATPIPRLEREIRLERVAFSYTPDRRTLDGIDAVIPAGSRVAFVGPTGAGKSSVLQLLMRLADPDEGAVRFDGHNLRSGTLESLRGQLGVVFQESFLFDATIRENIALGRPGATDADVEAAAKAAEIHDFISELPAGYETLVGERGGRLSGGQRQRLAIARALVRNPAVLILDEATSALDPQTEARISATLERVAKNRTTIAVTHRLNSITGYDRIFVIVAGKLVEQGTHAELVAKDGVYARLWTEQTGGVVASEPPFDAAAALAKVPLFSDLSPEELSTVAARLRPVELAAGERLPEGTGRLAFIRRGRGRVLVPAIGGAESTVPVADLGPGDAFGVSALLGHWTGAALVADGRMGLLVLDDEAVGALAQMFPTVGAALAGATAPSVAPAGGRRLSRMTILPVRGSLVSVAAGAEAGESLTPDGASLKRATGSFGGVAR